MQHAHDIQYVGRHVEHVAFGILFTVLFKSQSTFFSSSLILYVHLFCFHTSQRLCYRKKSAYYCYNEEKKKWKYVSSEHILKLLYGSETGHQCAISPVNTQSVITIVFWPYCQTVLLRNSLFLEQEVSDELYEYQLLYQHSGLKPIWILNLVGSASYREHVLEETQHQYN